MASDEAKAGAIGLVNDFRTRGLSMWGAIRREQLADAHGIPYLRDIERALRDFDVQVAIVSPEVERHCALSIRAANAGKHVLQDKPLATRLEEADRGSIEAAVIPVVSQMLAAGFLDLA